MRVFVLLALVVLATATNLVKTHKSHTHKAKSKLDPTIPDWCFDLQKVADHAKLTNTDERCAFYTQCAEKAFKCGSDVSNPNSYPINYGKKYCYKFSDAEFDNDISRQWRDATLPCLHEALVPLMIKARNGDVADCATVTTTGFDSHPRCYTQVGRSICDVALGLHLGDVWSIFTTVDLKDLITIRSAAQVASVARRCTGQAVDNVRAFFGDVSPELKPIKFVDIPEKNGIYLKIRDCTRWDYAEDPYWKCGPVAYDGASLDENTRETNIALDHDGRMYIDYDSDPNRAGFGMMWDYSHGGTGSCIRCNLWDRRRNWWDSEKDMTMTVCGPLPKVDGRYGRMSWPDGQGDCIVYYQKNTGY
jgi:hypothetical protein